MALTQTVRVWRRSQVGVDPMGDPVWQWFHEDVPGVLVRPASTAAMERGDTGSDVRPDSVRTRFALAFPKGYEGDQLRHARVTLLDPAYGMDASEDDGWQGALAVIGDPQPTVPCPTRWNMTVEVGRTDG